MADGRGLAVASDHGFSACEASVDVDDGYRILVRSKHSRRSFRDCRARLLAFLSRNVVSNELVTVLCANGFPPTWSKV
jgi:hypothetical protein